MLRANKRWGCVHRYIWERQNGLIPDGMVIDHICRNRACCNVDHLRVVSRAVNALENSISLPALNAKKTHCPKGHMYSESNTYRKVCDGGRICRKCHAERLRVARAKRKGVSV
jgi:hypothetical protein